MFLEETDQYH